jgi:hypothetical protein
MRLVAVLLVAGLIGDARAESPLLAAPVPPRAARDDAPPVGWSVGIGFGLALIPMAIGGSLAATSDDLRTKHIGIELIAGGLALAPLISHLVAREWKRAGYFTIAPMVLAAVAIGILEGSDSILDDGTAPARISFGAALAVELLASGVGLVDSLMAGERWKKRHPLSIVPTVGRNSIGLSIGGLL